MAWFPCEGTTTRRLPALRGRRPRGRGSGRHLFCLSYVFLFEVLDEPTSRGARRTVSPINRRHGDHVASGRHPFRCDLNESAAGEVRLDQVQRHSAKPETCTQEGEFRPEMGKAPSPRIRRSGHQRSREIRRIDVCEMDVLVENGCRNRPAAGRQRVLRRNDYGYPHRQQPFVGELRRRERP